MIQFFRTKLIIVIAALFALPATAWAQAAPDSPFELDWRELKPGVWAGVRPVSTRSPVAGTSVVVIGESRVLIYDAGGFPQQSENILRHVRAVTDLPVTDIVISHWHGDHSLGIYKILEAFPNARVISHAFTAAALQSPLMDYIRPGQEEGLGQTRAALERIFAEPPDPDGPQLPDVLRVYYGQMLADADELDAAMRGVRITVPTETFSTRMEIDLGGRIVELRHLGLGNTKGDAILIIPDARIIATADIVVRPTPYGFNSYPRDWADVLRMLKAMEFDYLVPGHGDIQTDTAYIDLLIETMELVADQVDAMAAEGLSLEEVRERIDFSPVEERFTGGDEFLANRFDAWFKTPITEAAYNVATGVDSESLEPTEDEE